MKLWLTMILLTLSHLGLAQAQESAVVTNATSTRSSTNNRFTSEWRLSLAGRDLQDEQSQAKVVDMRAEFKAKYFLHNSLVLDLQPAVRLQTGQTQSIDGADRPENRLILNQAAAHFALLPQVKLSAGALNQRHAHTTLLMDSIAFPAARAEMFTRGGSFRASLLGEVAIPTTTSFSTNTKELEETPQLSSVTAKLQWQKNRDFYIKSHVGVFKFTHLPSAVAKESRLLGNEIEKISDAHYRFLYEYSGYQAGLEAKFKMPWLKWTLGAEYVQNQEAPEAFAKAYRGYTNIELPLNKDKEILFGGSYFSVAPEAAVSYFNAGGFETNRNGYSAETALHFNKEGFNIGVRYTEAEVMFSNAIQSRERMWFLKLETAYAEI